jgi:hypothetical protein
MSGLSAEGEHDGLPLVEPAGVAKRKGTAGRTERFTASGTTGGLEGQAEAFAVIRATPILW